LAKENEMMKKNSRRFLSRDLLFDVSRNDFIVLDFLFSFYTERIILEFKEEEKHFCPCEDF
jgi:hypothetical protein